MASCGVGRLIHVERTGSGVLDEWPLVVLAALYTSIELVWGVLDEWPLAVLAALYTLNEVVQGFLD